MRAVENRARGLDDESVLKIAIAERRILVTNDKDFGRMVFRAGAGVCPYACQGARYIATDLGRRSVLVLPRICVIL
ncbi:MAG: DUF5615 family PIN-like protein [Bacillota bacterium]